MIFGENRVSIGCVVKEEMCSEAKKFAYYIRDIKGKSDFEYPDQSKSAKPIITNFWARLTIDM